MRPPGSLILGKKKKREEQEEGGGEEDILPYFCVVNTRTYFQLVHAYDDIARYSYRMGK